MASKGKSIQGFGNYNCSEDNSGWFAGTNTKKVKEDNFNENENSYKLSEEEKKDISKFSWNLDENEEDKRVSDKDVSDKNDFDKNDFDKNDTDKNDGIEAIENNEILENYQERKKEKSSVENKKEFINNETLESIARSFENISESFKRIANVLEKFEKFEKLDVEVINHFFEKP